MSLSKLLLRALSKSVVVCSIAAVIAACDGTTIIIETKPKSSSSSGEASSSSATSSSGISSSSSSSASSSSASSTSGGISDKDKELCAALNNNRYMSETLGEGGRSSNAMYWMHWRVEFKDGAMGTIQSDFGLRATYRCENGEVIISKVPDGTEEVLTFDQGLEILYFHPFGGDKLTYRRFEHEPGAKACDIVNGRRYELGAIKLPPQPFPAAQDERAEPVSKPPDPFFEFGENSQQVRFADGNSGYIDGLYICDTGELRIHRDEKDTDPIVADVSGAGKYLSVNIDGVEMILNRVDKEPIACTKEYAPVCAIDESILAVILCEKGKCPLGEYKTYGNKCMANAADSDIVHDGTCGDKEGKFAYPDSEPGACITLYDPVCAVKPENIQCVNAPCPIGSYKTYSNECFAKADGAIPKLKGECGEREGDPAYDDMTPVACPKILKPVCGAVTSSEPCLTLPCPKMTLKTFDNECLLKSAEAILVEEKACGEKEGMEYQGHQGACPAVFDPVCGKVSTNVVCVTEPCPNFKYTTLGNACEAALKRAPVLFDGECGDYQDQMVTGEPLVILTDKPPKSFNTPQVEAAEFDGDIVRVKLGHSGCSPHHHDFYVGHSFSRSAPTSVSATFVPIVEQLCDAFFITEFAYDLAPLKAHYQEVMGTTHGKIRLPEIGVYEF